MEDIKKEKKLELQIRKQKKQIEELRETIKIYAPYMRYE